MPDNLNAGGTPLPRTAADVPGGQVMTDHEMIPVENPSDPLETMLENQVGPNNGTDVTTPATPEPVTPAAPTPELPATPVTPAASPADLRDVLSMARSTMSDSAYRQFTQQLSDIQRRADAFDIMSSAMQNPVAPAPRAPAMPQKPQINMEAMVDQALAEGKPIGRALQEAIDSIGQYHAQVSQQQLESKLASMIQNQVGNVENQIKAFRSDLELKDFSKSNPELMNNPLVRRAMIGQIQEMVASGEVSQTASPADILGKAMNSVKSELKSLGVTLGESPASPKNTNTAQTLKTMAANSVARGGQTPPAPASAPIKTTEDAVAKAMAFLSGSR